MNHKKLFLCAGIRQWLVPGCILFAGLLLRLTHLHDSLWSDEITYSTHIVFHDTKILSSILAWGKGAPFYNLFMFFWVKLFGDSEFSVRMPPLISGLLSMLLTYRLVLGTQGRRNAVLVMLLLCLSAVHIWYSQEAAPYSIVLTFLLLSVLSSQQLRSGKESVLLYIIYFTSLLLAVLAHWFSLSFVAASSVICAHKINGVKKKVLLLNIIIFALSAGLIFIKSIRGGVFTGVGFLRPFTLFEMWMLFFNWFILGNSIWTIPPYRHYTRVLSTIISSPLMLLFQMFVFVIFVRGVMRLFKANAGPFERENIIYLFCLPVSVLALTFLGIKHIYIERYVFVALPFFYMVIIKGATGFRRKSLENTALSVILIAGIVALVCFFYKTDDWTVYKKRPDWRSVTRYFIQEQEIDAKPRLIFTTSPPLSLLYYKNWLGKEYQFDVKFKIYLEDYDRVKEIVSGNNTEVFYLVENKYWKNRFDELLQSVKADAGFKQVAEKSFKGIEVFKFKKAGQPIK